MTLRDYQLEGVAFLAAREGALLADEMGLGKTAQAISALRIALSHNGKSALVVAPSSLIKNWEREFRLWAPDLVVRRVRGDREDRLAYYQLPIAVLLATYDQIRRDALSIPSGTGFEVVVLDEAQRIKNRHSETSLTCRLLRRRRSWALSATPLENSRNDLVSILTFLSPGAVRLESAPQELRSTMKPLYLRRTKSKVATELPPIIDQTLRLELTEDQDLAYWELRTNAAAHLASDSATAASLLALITRLKQVCNREPDSGSSSKLEALKTVVENLDPGNAKLLVFSQYVETLSWLQQELSPVKTLLFHGGLSSDERDRVLQTFRDESVPVVLLMSLRAGGVGLNIPEAGTVVLFDRWWNPAVEDQAIQRAHRLGRTTPLHVVRFLVENTVEDRIIALLHQKKELFLHYVSEAPLAEDCLDHAQLRALLEMPGSSVSRR